MAIRKFLSFLLQTIMTGLAAAFLYILLIDPDLLRNSGTIVEVIESSQQTVAETATDNATDTTRKDNWNGPVSYADAVEKAVPAVVNIHTAKVITHRAHPLLKDPIFQKFFGDRFAKARKELQTSLGSGVLISSQGFVLTNNHVIEGADQINILLADGRSARARVVGTDLDTDLAILHITIEKLPSIIIGDSSRLRVGDVALAIGNPFGVGQTVTSGIISATGRNHLGITAYEDFIQTDAAINPGNSGGALINTQGELIAINSAIYSKSGGSQGIGFAIPINLAKGVMTQIIENGYVVRGWLGIEAQDLTAQVAKRIGLSDTTGMLIGAVIDDGPAADAGLLAGDIILTVNGEPVVDTSEVMKTISLQQPGTVIELGGLRKGASFTTRAKVIQRPGRTRPAS